ncbi:unnamed protein product, partial [Brassica rapa]
SPFLSNTDLSEGSSIFFLICKCNIFDQSDRLLFGDFWSVSRSFTK